MSARNTARSLFARGLMFGAQFAGAACGCAPYAPCDETLELGDQLVFDITEWQSDEELSDECKEALPFWLGSQVTFDIEEDGVGRKCSAYKGDAQITDGVLLTEEGWPDDGYAADFNARYPYEGLDGICFLELLVSGNSLKFALRAELAERPHCPVSCEGRFGGTRSVKRE